MVICASLKASPILFSCFEDDRIGTGLFYVLHIKPAGVLTDIKETGSKVNSGPLS